MTLAAAVLPRGLDPGARLIEARNSVSAQVLLEPLLPLAQLVQGGPGSMRSWLIVPLVALACLVIVRGMDGTWEELSDRFAAKAKHGGRKSEDAGKKPGRTRRAPSLTLLDPLLGPARAIVERHVMGSWMLLRFLPVLLIAILAGPAFLPEGFIADLGMATVFAMPFLVAVLVISAVLQLDFRSDLASVEWLKTLPIGPHRMAWGQVLLAPLLAALLGITGAVSVAVHEGWNWLAAAAALLTGPGSLLLVALLNAGFLLFPTQKGKRAGFDFYKVGRGAVLGAGFAAVVAVTLLPAAAAAWGVSLIPGAGWTHIIAAAAVIIAAAAAAAVRVLASIYDRFDVSRDMPESE